MLDQDDPGQVKTTQSEKMMAWKYDFLWPKKEVKSFFLKRNYVRFVEK